MTLAFSDEQTISLPFDAVSAAESVIGQVLDQELCPYEAQVSLTLTDNARAHVISEGYDPVYGARPLKRYLQKNVETLAARKILSGGVHEGDTLVLDYTENGFEVV